MADHRINLNMANPAEGRNGHFAWINLFHGSTGLGSRANVLARFSSFLGANGIPSSSPPDDSIQCITNVPPSYSGSWLLKWTGTETITLDTGVVITNIVDPGGVVISSSGGVLKVAGTNGRVTFQTPGTNGVWFAGFPSGTYSSPGVPALMITANEAAYDSGKIFNSDFITACKTLNPKVIRMMKWGYPTLFSQPFTFGKPQDYFNWTNAYFPPALYAGDISSANGTTFICSAAPSTPGTITEGELIHGWTTAANTGAPTLNVGGRGAKPILSEFTGVALGVGELSSGIVASFVYDVVLDSYWYMGTVDNAGFANTGTPISVMVELCNEVGCGMWYCFPVMTKVSEFRLVADYIRDNLNGTAWFEFSNEVWGGAPSLPNGVLELWSHVISPSNIGYGDPLALRSRQIHGAATDSWNAIGRPLSSLKRVIATFDGADPALVLTGMDGSNLASYGFSTAPNRPIDFMDVFATNTYIDGPNVPTYDNTVSYVAAGIVSLGSGLINPASVGDTVTDTTTSVTTTIRSAALAGATSIHLDTVVGINNGDSLSVAGHAATVSGIPILDQLGLYTAADNYASGNPTSMASALDFMDNDIRSGTGGNTVGITDTLGYKQNTPWPLMENAVTAYDSSRISAGKLPIEVVAYEGAVQILQPSVATLNALGLNGALYGGDAGRIAVLFNAYKNDARCKKLCLDLFGTFSSASNTHFTTPAWYDMVGDLSRWSLYPDDLYSTPFQSFNAIQSFDTIGTKNLKGDF